MKTIIIILLLGISLSYNPIASVNYARKYCNTYNPKYYNYNPMGGDCANFVSQCMAAGGQDFHGCNGVDPKGMIPHVPSLKACLSKKKWKHSLSKPVNFKAGYPIFLKSNLHGMLATGIDGNNIIYCSHNADRCNGKISSSSVEFYYL